MLSNWCLCGLFGILRKSNFFYNLWNLSKVNLLWKSGKLWLHEHPFLFYMITICNLLNNKSLIMKCNNISFIFCMPIVGTRIIPTNKVVALKWLACFYKPLDLSMHNFSLFFTLLWVHHFTWINLPLGTIVALTQWSFISHISWNTWTFKHPLFPFFFHSYFEWDQHQGWWGFEIIKVWWSYNFPYKVFINVGKLLNFDLIINLAIKLIINTNLSY